MLSSFSASIKRSSRSLSRRKFALSSSHSKTLNCIHWPKFLSTLKILLRRLSFLISYEITMNIRQSPTERVIRSDTQKVHFVNFALKVSISYGACVESLSLYDNNSRTTRHAEQQGFRLISHLKAST